MDQPAVRRCQEPSCEAEAGRGPRCVAHQQERLVGFERDRYERRIAAAREGEGA